MTCSTAECNLFVVVSRKLHYFELKIPSTESRVGGRCAVLHDPGKERSTSGS